MTSDIPGDIADLFRELPVPLVLTDPGQPDEPMIMVNQPFCVLTGYAEAELLGRNCRMLQGRDSQRSSREIIRRDLADQRDCRVLIRNHRKDGTAFDNLLLIVTLVDDRKRPLYRIGAPFAVPDRHRAEALETHSRHLRAGLERLTLAPDGHLDRKQAVLDAATLTPRALLQARLTVLRHQV